VKKKNAIIVVLCIAIIVFFILGIYLGYEKGTAELTYDLESSFDSGLASELGVHTKLLNHLQNGEIEKSKEILEYLVDNDIVFLDFDLRKQRVKYPAPMEKRMRDAIRAAKKYRELYPNHKPKLATVKKEVDAAFRRISG